MDFLLLVSSQYRGRSLTLDDACAHCVDRIQIGVADGGLARVSPDETIVYRGGT